ncbi:MAG TPA: hypothetical protein VEI50_05670 [Nitrospiraceae bacterium]|jgi:hypothetical protein|nr:hypothetical protein [Nitrospiraceae bacterium]
MGPSHKFNRTAIAATGLSLVATLVGAQPHSDPSASKTVTGEVSTVEGEFHMAKTPQGEDILEIVDKSYVVTTRTGEELRLELSRDTKVPQRANPGDRIEARISQEGHTLSVTRIE